MAKRTAPIGTAVEAVQRMHEVEDFEPSQRLSAIAQLIAKIRKAPADRKLVVFDAPKDRASTAGNIATRLRKQNIDAFTRTVRDHIKVYVLTHSPTWVHPSNRRDTSAADAETPTSP